MATQTYAASVQGVALRITKLDEAGNLLTGPMDSYTTSSFIRVSFTPEYEDGDEITEKAADGTICISYKAPSTLKRVNTEIAICDPDPELSALISGGLLLEQMGKSVGWASAQVGEDPSGNGVAVEIWSRAVINGKPAADRPYFHWVFPHVKMKLSGDRVIENGLLATTFDGEGIGNINFRSGIDGSWLWPAATDRPYLYARVETAPTGMRGFYTWAPGLPTSVTGGSPAAAAGTPINAFPSGSNPIAINVPKTTTPYPWNTAIPADQILSVTDFKDDISAIPDTAEYPDYATDHDVKNTPPTGSTQPPVAYLQRGDPKWDKAHVAPGAKFPADAGITGSTAPMAAKLTGLGYLSSGTKWTTGSKVTIGGFDFYWTGTAWAAGASS